MTDTVWQIDPPTEPGWYEYRWTHGTPKMRHQWIKVEVVKKKGELWVIDPGTAKPSHLNTYTGAEWCRRG